MAEVVGLNRFPLTGAQAEELDYARIGVSGIVGDRLLVAYDVRDDKDVKDRIGQKQLPALARLSSIYGDRPRFGLDEPFKHGSVEVTIPDTGWLYSYPDQETKKVIIDEFGDQTPCQKVELFESVSSELRTFLGHYSLGLARKDKSWIQGAFIKPEDRAVAPLHVIAQSSVGALQSEVENAEFGAERFRANLVLGGDFEPYSEQEWVGKVLKIGDALIKIHRGTKRCQVPGFDQSTGENKKDVPKLYRHLPKAGDMKPLFGVYGYPIVDQSQSIEVRLGDQAELI